MIPRIPFIFKDGEKLSFSKISNNLIRMWSDLKYSRDRNIVKSSFVIDFTGLTVADTVASKRFHLTPPIDIEILNTEIEVYSSGAISNVTFANLSNANFTTLSTDVTAVAGNRGYASAKQNIRVTGGVVNVFQLALTGNVSSIKVTISYSSQRIQKKSFLANLPVFEMANTLVSLITKLNTNLSLYAVEATANEAADKDLRIVVYSVINNTAAGITKSSTRIPSNLRRLDSMMCNIVMLVGSTVQVQLLDETASIINTASNPGAGTGSVATVTNAIGDTQTLDAPTSPGSDYTLNISRTLGVATINSLHVVLYYT